MNKRNSLTKFIGGAALVVAFVVGVSTAVGARMGQRQPATQPDNGATYFIGLLRVASNRSVRIAAVNHSDHDVPVELTVIDAEGKILILCDAMVASGKGFAHVLDTSNLQTPTDLYARYRTNKKSDLDDLSLTLQVIDNATGITEIALVD